MGGQGGAGGPGGADGQGGADGPGGRCLVLLMRKQLRFRSFDHIQALLDLAVDVHLVTVQTQDVADGDPRFASILRVPAGAQDADVLAAVLDVARVAGARAVITFAEVDIVIAGAANEKLGVEWACNAADRISRDKARQREFLDNHGIASVWHYPVSDVREAVAVARERRLPLIVKPTRAASSSHVELVTDLDRLAAALTQIESLAKSKSRAYYNEMPRHWALLEEYLPGREVTLDAVVLDGEFMLGGICGKLVSPGPFFEEDLYTFPFDVPDSETELIALAASITSGLGVGSTLFNAEFRQDADGKFAVIEFSTRISGGHVYRNIKDVHGIDLVRMFARRACGDPASDIVRQENRRSAPRMTTCNKVIFATGSVVRNSAGETVHSPHFRAYYPMARPGERVAAAPIGFDTVGTLSVRTTWKPGQAPAQVHAIAHDLAAQLDIEIRPDAP
jgi:biotin carboxylase